MTWPPDVLGRKTEPDGGVDGVAPAIDRGRNDSGWCYAALFFGRVFLTLPAAAFFPSPICVASADRAAE